MIRQCDNCKTKLPNGQGFVVGRKVLCGRSETVKSVRGSLTKVKLTCYKW